MTCVPRFPQTRTPMESDVVVTDTVLSVDGAEASDWHFEESLLDAEHCVCTAVRGKSPRVAPRFEIMTDFSKLLDELQVIAPTPSLVAASKSDWETFLGMTENKPF